jgi:chorismate synthase
VGEAVVAWVLAEAVLEKFGGDTLGDLEGAIEAYRQRIRPQAR